MNKPGRLCAALGLLAAAACTDVTCLADDCPPVLDVRFANPVAFPYRVQVTTPDDVVHSRDCAEASGSCSATGISFALQPATATVKVITLAGQIATVVTPEYNAPAGGGCASQCIRGVVTVAVPAS
jgi:hypothetical protein